MDDATRKATALVLIMTIAPAAEGIRHIAYYDPPGILTVCMGHTGADVIKDKVYSMAECDAYLDKDMRKAIDLVDRCMPGLPAHILAAFGDAVFNMGSTIACNLTKSTAARYLKAGNYTEACNQLPRWDKANIFGVMVSLPGLTTRRELEKHLCLTGKLS